MSEEDNRIEKRVMDNVLQAMTHLHDAAVDFFVYVIKIFTCLFYKILTCSTLVIDQCCEKIRAYAKQIREAYETISLGDKILSSLNKTEKYAYDIWQFFNNTGHGLRKIKMTMSKIHLIVVFIIVGLIGRHFLVIFTYEKQIWSDKPVKSINQKMSDGENSARQINDVLTNLSESKLRKINVRQKKIHVEQSRWPETKAIIVVISNQAENDKM